MDLFHKHKNEEPKKFWTTFLAPPKSHGIVSILCLSRHIRNQLTELGFYDAGDPSGKTECYYPLRRMSMGISLYKCLEPEALEVMDEDPNSYVGVKTGRKVISSKEFSIRLKEYFHYLLFACWEVDEFEGIMPEQVKDLYSQLYEGSIADNEIGNKYLCDLTKEDFDNWAKNVKGALFVMTELSTGTILNTSFENPVHMMKYVLDYAVGVHGLLQASPLEPWFCDWQDLMYSPKKSQKLDILKFSSLNETVRHLFEMHMEEDGGPGLMSNFVVREK